MSPRPCRETLSGVILLMHGLACRLNALEKAEAPGAWAPFSRIYAVLQPLGWDLLRTHLGPQDKATLALVEAYETLHMGAAWTGLQSQLQAEGQSAENTGLLLHVPA